MSTDRLFYCEKRNKVMLQMNNIKVIMCYSIIFTTRESYTPLTMVTFIKGSSTSQI